MARSENIQVSLRLRPLNSKEIEENERTIWKLNKHTVSLKPEWMQILQEQKRLSGTSRSYSYNHCFSSKDTNATLYSTMARRVVMASLEGYNGTIFVYGQTGSGKTYTMMGPPDQITEDRRRKLEIQPGSGLVLLSLQDLFNHVKDNPDKHYFLACSYIEIYNEQVYDLLADEDFKIEVLTVNEDPQRGFYVKGLSEHIVSSLEETLKYIEKGETNRRYAETAMNHHSSRSHTIFRLFVTSVSITGEDEGNITTESVLNFVDLAGSERASNLQDEPRRRSMSRSADVQTEGKHINTSLFYLCQVINRLSEKNISKTDMHIPYRNSNLTKILRSSLGGNSLTSIICTATPTYSQYEMTLSTLRFGGIARNITNKVAANIRSNKNAELLQAYQRDIDMLKKEVEMAQEGGKARLEEAANVKKHLEERIQRLTHMLFNQSRQEHLSKSGNETQVQHEMWASQVGDLIIDTRLQSPPPSKPSLRFDEKGAFAIERMRMMHKEHKKKECELQELKENKMSLLDSKNNLKNDLKKALSLCKDLSDKNSKHKNKLGKLKELHGCLNTKLSVLEKLTGLERISVKNLENLELFFFRALDSVKNEKFKRRCLKKAQEVDPNAEVLCESPLPRIPLDIWSDMGVPEEAEFSPAEDSSLEYEASFYRSKRYSGSTDMHESTMVFANLLENEFEHKLSPITGGFLDSGVPFGN